MDEQVFTAAESITALVPAINLFIASGVPLGQIANDVSNIVQSMALRVEEAARVTDVLAQASNNANVTVDGLAVSISRAAPEARTFGLSLEELAGAAQVLGNTGIFREDAGTKLRIVFRELELAGFLTKKWITPSS